PVGARHNLGRRRPGAVATLAATAALRSGGRPRAVATVPRRPLPVRHARGRGARRRGGGAPAVRIGIVGLPNAGKSSLFNALTRAGAEVATYPFTTVEANVAVVPVPDERLDRVAEIVGASPIVYETIAFHDIAGLVRGAHPGEVLRNQLLANIREP